MSVLICSHQHDHVGFDGNLRFHDDTHGGCR
jgi:hypothetical protein